MIHYLPFENEVSSPYIGTYCTFGLRVLQSRDGFEDEIMLLPDISTDFSFVLRLAALFTRKQLNPIHLLDVLEDLL